MHPYSLQDGRRVYNIAARAKRDAGAGCPRSALSLTRARARASGVSDVQIDMEGQKINVVQDEGGATPEAMLAALEKWGASANKKVELVGTAEGSGSEPGLRGTDRRTR